MARQKQSRKTGERAKAGAAGSGRGSGKLRIIGGEWRSRQLPILDAEGLRPTTDRVRETLFNWLQTSLPGRRCLDLFAGTGALGFEAASRGAAEVVMVEFNAAVCRQLEQNRALLAANQVKCVQADALQYSQQPGVTEGVDVVFLDPPYQSGLLEPVAAQLKLAPGTLVYVEYNRVDTPALPANWQILKDKTAGQIRYCLYEVTEQQDT